MTGFEYTAAVGMLYEDDLDNGLKCIQAIRDYYDGQIRNPFDEAECGHHYARAMASWVAILALSGFYYSAMDKSITFVTSDKACQLFGSTGYVWGTCQLTPNTDDSFDVVFNVLYGVIEFNTFHLGAHGKHEFDQMQSLQKGDALTFNVTRS